MYNNYTNQKEKDKQLKSKLIFTVEIRYFNRHYTKEDIV